MAMSAAMISDPMVLQPPVAAAAAAETQPQQATKLNIAQIEIEFVKCDCCGLTEECTPAYIQHVRERYQGHWICGLCAEAIKDELARSERLISTEEAMVTHMNFCKKFKASGPPPNPTVHLISAMRQILRRSLDSPRGGLRSTPTSPTKINNGGKGLTRSESCFPTLTG